MDHHPPPPSTDSAWALRTGLALAGLEPHELWVACVAMGGNLEEGALLDALTGTAPVTARQHDLLALTLNDSLLELGIHFPVAYAGELLQLG